MHDPQDDRCDCCRLEPERCECSPKMEGETCEVHTNAERVED